MATQRPGATTTTAAAWRRRRQHSAWRPPALMPPARPGPRAAGGRAFCLGRDGLERCGYLAAIAFLPFLLSWVVLRRPDGNGGRNWAGSMRGCAGRVSMDPGAEFEGGIDEASGREIEESFRASTERAHAATMRRDDDDFFFCGKLFALASASFERGGRPPGGASTTVYSPRCAPPERRKGEQQGRLGMKNDWSTLSRRKHADGRRRRARALPSFLPPHLTAPCVASSSAIAARLVPTTSPSF